MFGEVKTHKKIRTIRQKGMRRTQLELLALMVPGVILLFMFNYAPMFGAIIAFKEYNPNLGILKSAWVGLKNFEFFFKSQDALRVSMNTLGYAVLFRIVGIITEVSLAVVLYEITSRFALKVYHTIMILPHFLSWVLVGYITYAILNPTYGILNDILVFFGKSEIDVYSNPSYWPLILTVTYTWKVIGMNSVIYYAALMGIDASLIEAAKIDGANKFQEITKIKIPQIASVICILLILGMGSIFHGDFGLFYQIPRDIGTLYPTTDIVDTYIYRGIKNADIGATSAVGLFQAVVGLIMILGSNAIVRKIDPDSSMF